MPNSPSKPMLMNHSVMIGPSSAPMRAVPWGLQGEQPNPAATNSICLSLLAPPRPSAFCGCFGNPEIHIWQPLVQHFAIAKTLHFLATPQSDDLGGALHAAASSLSLRGLLQCRITPACRSSEVFLVL